MKARSVLVAMTGVLLVCSMNAKREGVKPPFPGRGQPWPKVPPESQGMSSQVLRDARDLMRTSEEKPFVCMDGLIIRNGRHVWSFGAPYELRKGMGASNDWASCGRSLMTTMYGMLMKDSGETMAALDRPVKEIKSFSGREKLDDRVLLKHLLGYASCADPPGTGWQYACNYFLIYKIIRDVDGLPPRYRLERLAS